MRTFPDNNRGFQIGDDQGELRQTAPDGDESATEGSNSPLGHNTFSVRVDGFETESDEEKNLRQVLRNVTDASRFVERLQSKVDLAPLREQFEQLKRLKTSHLDLSVIDNYISLLYLYQIVCHKIYGFSDGRGEQGKGLILKELKICVQALQYVQPAILTYVLNRQLEKWHYSPDTYLSGRAGKSLVMTRNDIKEICPDQGEVDEMAMQIKRQCTRIMDCLSNREQKGTSVTFGPNNKGFQAGTLYGNLRGVKFGN